MLIGSRYAKKKPVQEYGDVVLDTPLDCNVKTMKRMKSLKRALLNNIDGILEYSEVSKALEKIDTKFDSLFEDSLQFVKTKEDVLSLARQLR